MADINILSFKLANIYDILIWICIAPYGYGKDFMSLGFHLLLTSQSNDKLWQSE